MNSFHALLFANIISESLTDYLGVIAIMAFAVTVGGVLLLMARDVASKHQRHEEIIKTQLCVKDAAKNSETVFREEALALDKECREFFGETINSGRVRLKELVVHARLALREIDKSYVGSSKTSGASGSRYLSACQAYWYFLKRDLGFVGFKEIEPYLHKALDSSVLEGIQEGVQECSLEEGDEKVVQVRLLYNSLTVENFGAFYRSYLSSVDEYKSFFKMHMKEWLGELKIELTRKLRFKSGSGVTINDTEQKTQLVRLKNTLDILDKVSDRLESNSSEIGDENAAFMQILFGGVALGIVSELPNWFMEVGDLGLEAKVDDLKAS
ncbi:hypothetical protein MLD52_00455 [Puniceicoccaceae bacterium K14]|nr:hypothetical protein [Puniceicoccaceae bacterium K14]